MIERPHDPPIAHRNFSERLQIGLTCTGCSALQHPAAASCRAAGAPRTAPTTALNRVQYLWTLFKACLGLGMAQQAACSDNDHATVQPRAARGSSIGDIAIAQTPGRQSGVIARCSKFFSCSRYQSRVKGSKCAGSDSTARTLICAFLRVLPARGSEPGGSTSPAGSACYQVALLYIARLVLGERTLQVKDDIGVALIWVFSGFIGGEISAKACVQCRGSAGSPKHSMGPAHVDICRLALVQHMHLRTRQPNMASQA